MSSLKVLYCVFFFGSHNYGWLPEADLKPYKEFKIAKMNTKKNSFKKAIDEIEAYIESVKTNLATGSSEILGTIATICTGRFCLSPVSSALRTKFRMAIPSSQIK